MLLPFWLALLDAALTGVFTVRGLLGWQQGRYVDRLMRQLPDAVELVIGAVRAGLPVAEAFRAVAREMPNPTGEQFAYVTNDLALGRTPEDALLNLYHRTHVAEYAIFAVTLAVQSRSGGRLAETIQIMGDTVRQRIILAGRAKALAGEAKLSAQVLSVLPFIGAGALSFERPGYLDPLLHEPRGQKLLVFGIVSLLLGIITMRRMIKKATMV
jgi:tight adherence protein B